MTCRNHPVERSRLRKGVIALSLALIAVPALADDDCNAPVERWQSRDAVQQMAAQRGWQVQRLKIDDGCYEIRGSDADGRAFKARVDPETLQLVKITHRSRDRGSDPRRHPDRARERDARSATPTDAPGTPSPVFEPGTAPRAKVD